MIRRNFHFLFQINYFLWLFILCSVFHQAENDPIAPSRGIPREDIKVLTPFIYQLLELSLIFQIRTSCNSHLSVYPFEQKENPNCLLIVTPEGGHLGWVAGDEAPFGCPWTDPVVMEFLEHLHNQGDEKTSTANYLSDELNENNRPSDSSVIVHIQQ